MKVKLSELIESFPALQALASTKLPAKISYQVGKFVSIYTKELELYDKVRLEKAKELGTLTEDGQSYQFQGENAAIFKTETEELLAVEVEISKEPIKVADLGDVEIEAKHLAVLDGIVISE